MKQIKIIFEDKDILVIDKPAGLVVEKDAKTKPSQGETLEDILKKDFQINLPRAGIVHRLDRDTSGLMVVAKTEKALVNLQNQFQSHQVEKKYIALVLGRMEAGEGTIDIALRRDPKNGTRFIASKAKDARRAVTHYKTAETIRGLSLLEINLETGRTHQIRAHFFSIGHPVIGDQIYKNGLSESISKELNIDRQFLHAEKLSFTHPVTGKKLNFQSNLPNDLVKIKNKL
ncbi:RluA family pseudouridine synthase [Candidatus Microgenomates bacterium]|nr:RluA family pseudouridine synthase [Candidatus Microgenomates bacterium]